MLRPFPKAKKRPYATRRRPGRVFVPFGGDWSLRTTQSCRGDQESAVSVGGSYFRRLVLGSKSRTFGHVILAKKADVEAGVSEVRAVVAAKVVVEPAGL